MCGTTCDDLGTSAINCGACGHGCLGGGCTGGHCGPALVKSDNFDDFLLSSGRIYLVSAVYGTQGAVTNVRYIPEDAAPGAGPVDFFSTMDTLCHTMQLDPGAGFFYMHCESLPGGYADLQRLRTRNGVALTRLDNLSIGLQTPIVISPTTSVVYWAITTYSAGRGWIFSDAYNPTGDVITPYIKVGSNAHPTVLAADDTSFFFNVTTSTGAQVLAEIDLGPGDPPYTPLSATTATSAFSDGATLFYANAAGISSTPKGMMAPSPVLADPTVTTIFEVDGTWVYYVAETPTTDAGGVTTCASYRIARVAKAGGGTPEVLVTDTGSGAASCVLHVTSDGAVIAWTKTGTPRQLYKVAK
jgi:hypothetical protein